MGAFVAQLVVATGTITGLLLAPPPFGDLLLIPVTPHVSSARFAFDDGRTVISVAPAGGVIVRGPRGGWFRALRRGVLIVSAPASLCGRGVA